MAKYHTMSFPNGTSATLKAKLCETPFNKKWLPKILKYRLSQSKKLKNQSKKKPG
jgi:hypothetical protein